jgi:hypothetical protein
MILIMPMPAVRIGLTIVHISYKMVGAGVTDAGTGAIGVACDVAQTATEATAATAIAIATCFMFFSSLE